MADTNNTQHVKMNGNSEHHWPQDVGILHMEMYFPKAYVDQTELETYDGASAGKYTIGLGQTAMGFCSDREDIQSLCLTVVNRLFERSGVTPKDIGFLMVGTETLVDKSKSVKSVLMQLFKDSGNTDIEGVDTTNACYGGTSSLFSAVNWIESSSWDGRFAIAVAADIAIYASGAARPTGGAGAVAMLIGPNAPLVLLRNCRATHMAHTYDFYKPHMNSEYPVVDGKSSIACYTEAVDKCYQLFHKKYSKLIKEKEGRENFQLNEFDGLLFHSPYCKLVQKSVARLALNQFMKIDKPDFEGEYKGCEKYHKKSLEESYFDRDLEKIFLVLSDKLFQEKTKPSLLLATQIGNMYTASLYSCLVSHFLSKSSSEAAGKRLLLFSYGSGLASSMFVVKIASDHSPGSPLDKFYKSIENVKVNLNTRLKVQPSDFESILKVREETHHLCPYKPTGSVDNLFPGTYYLDHIDDLFRRFYERKTLEKSA